MKTKILAAAFLYLAFAHFYPQAQYVYSWLYVSVAARECLYSNDHRTPAKPTVYFKPLTLTFGLSQKCL